MKNRYRVRIETVKISEFGERDKGLENDLLENIASEVKHEYREDWRAWIRDHLTIQLWKEKKAGRFDK